MPWPTLNMNEVRREFVTKAQFKTASFASLCREFGISRKTGYKWWQRAREDGLRQLGERSRRPRSHPKQLDEETTCRLIELKLKHRSWGPVKLCAVHARLYGSAPSVSSCHRVLRKVDLVEPRPRRATHDPARIMGALAATKPNDVWTVDFKGWWRLGDGHRCEPLTVRDAFSCYVLTVKVVEAANTLCVRAEFERLFELHGLPGAIKSDNGAPFATASGVRGLSQLSAWWVALGIGLDRSRPGHPQDNAAHERMHRDIENEVAQCVQRDGHLQQAACDVWREEYNCVRPHQTLKNQTPRELYTKSTRRFVGGSFFPIKYPDGVMVRKITSGGTLKWRRENIFISAALAGWHVGLRAKGPDQLDVYLNYLPLGVIDLPTLSFRGAPSSPTEAQRLPA
jgi:putative transposase